MHSACIFNMAEAGVEVTEEDVEEGTEEELPTPVPASCSPICKGRMPEMRRPGDMPGLLLGSPRDTVHSAGALCPAGLLKKVTTSGRWKQVEVLPAVVRERVAAWAGRKGAQSAITTQNPRGRGKGSVQARIDPSQGSTPKR